VVTFSRSVDSPGAAFTNKGETLGFPSSAHAHSWIVVLTVEPTEYRRRFSVDILLRNSEKFREILFSRLLLRAFCRVTD